MTARTQLKWPVPCSPWGHHERRTIDRYGTKRLYAGIEAERIARLWLTFEETDAIPRADHTGAALKETKRTSETPLAEQEKIEVHRDFHSETKERLSVYAKRYDVNKGVLLGYILREYYETDGWGYGIEAAEANDRGVPDEDDEPEIPYRESEKIEWIAERIEPDSNGMIHGDDIRELVTEAGAASRVEHYLESVLDHLGFVHHPDTYGLYIPQEQRWEKFGILDDDPAIERKPYEALTHDEKVDGIKAVLQRTGKGFSVNGIHSAIFDGKGSTAHMHDLAQEVVNANGFTSGGSPGGTMVVRAAGSGSDTDTITDASGDTQTTLTDADANEDTETESNTDTDSEAETETESEYTLDIDGDTVFLDDESDKSLSATNQFPIDELGPDDQVPKIQIAVTRQMLREGCASARFSADDIQEALARDGDGEIGEVAMEARMETAANGSGFSLRTTDHGRELAVDCREINRGIEIMAEQRLEEEEESIPDDVESDDEDSEESGESADRADEDKDGDASAADEIDDEREMKEALRGHPNTPEQAMTDGGTADDDGDDPTSDGGDGGPI